MTEHFDVPEIVGKLHEAGYQMERFHQRDHTAQPSDWRFCSAEPCAAVHALWSELDDTIERAKQDHLQR